MDAFTTAAAAVIFIIALAIVLSLLFSVIKNLLKLSTAIVANSIVGLVAVLLLTFIGVKIPLTIPVIASIALFGLGAVGTLLILLFSGVTIG